MDVTEKERGKVCEGSWQRIMGGPAQGLEFKMNADLYY